MKEITRKEYFKLKNVYLNLKLIRRIIGFIFALFVLALLVFGTLITVYEQNQIVNSMMENKEQIAIIIRNGMFVSFPIFVCFIVVCFIFKRRLLHLKRKLDIIDEI